ncbi:SH3 domain-containing YSC84-like protein 1 [Hyaloraphidium curvatum]|nr:SH3 domain-containing YSC84-like protein 1 [Hyaloraphidium curvatum]
MKEVKENVMHMNPLPENMDKECEKAAETLNNVINPGKGIDFFIPKSILDRAKGLAIMHVIKVAWGWSGRAGSGIVVAKLPDGTWSAPSAIGIVGAGWGAQMGAQVSDIVMVLATDDAVRSFQSRANLTFGVEIAFAIGPIGRTGELDIALADLAPLYTYSKTKGLFAGISLEGSVIIERQWANEAKYGKGVRAEDILKGSVPRPAGSERLYAELAELDARAAKNAKEAAEKLKPTAAAPDF